MGVRNMWTLSLPRDSALVGTREDHGDGYGPSDTGALGISKKENSTTNLCLTEAQGP